jgi:predicted NBD/HSP70 family sugar kinase
MNIAVLDIGATAIKTGMIENINEEKHLPILTQKKETPSNAHLGGHCLMETVREIISGYSGYSRIGISTAGQVDSEQGIIRYANENIPG